MADSTPSETTPTVSTSAVGQTRGPPDRVVLRFEVRAVEPDVTSARRAVVEQSATLRTVLVDAGVADESVKTLRFRVDQRRPDSRRNREEDPDDLPYEATETVGVTLDDLDALGDVLRVAVDDARTEVDGVTFTFQTETKRELEREAVADAVATARAKAEAAAAAEGLAVGDVRSMTTEDRSRPRRSGARLSAEAHTESGTAPASGPIDVTVGVDVEYELTETT